MKSSTQIRPNRPHLAPWRRGIIAAALLTATAVGAGLAPAQSAGVAPHPRLHGEQLSSTSQPPLPAPPAAPSHPQQPTTSFAQPSTTSTSSTTSSTSLTTNLTAKAAAAPSASPGSVASGTKTLVLFDTTGDYGWLGELYAMGSGVLASHFGSVTYLPVSKYTAGTMNGYRAVIYLGSTYNEVLPSAFLADVRAGTTPVLWAGYNVWQLSGEAGSPQSAAFADQYGWQASTSYLDGNDQLASVTYKDRTLTRDPASGAVLSPNITDPAKVTVLGTVSCGGPCDAIAQTTGDNFPWAIRSGNLTYVGEVPLSYIDEHNRYLAYADLLFPLLDPTAQPSHKAAVRLEDVNPTSDPQVLRQFVDYFASQNVPFSVGVIPEYRDPTGYYNGGKPQQISLTQRPALVSALQYAQAHGGTLVQHGDTHQYDGINNPYNQVSADDFEFFGATCASYPCTDNTSVQLTGPLAGETAKAWTNRVSQGQKAMVSAKLGTPTIFETPHYAASAMAYKAIGTVYGTRYERELFFGGTLVSGNSPKNYFGQFFPYTVTDVYNTRILPETMGNYEPQWFSNHPPRLVPDLLANAAANQVVTQGNASFFFHLDYPLSELQATVQGVKDQGYTFVPAVDMN